MNTDHTTADQPNNPCPHTPTHWPFNMIACDQPDDFGVPMKPRRFIHHDDGTSTFIPDQPDGEELRQEIEAVCSKYGYFLGLAYEDSDGNLATHKKEVVIDKLEALLRRHVLTATLEARIAVYKQIEDNWHHNNVKTYILDLHNEDIKRLAALRDELAGSEGQK